MKTEIDFENSYLVIYKTKNGEFKKFDWVSPDKILLERLEARIIEYNEEQKLQENGVQAELITDKLIREICAYRQSSESLEDLEDSAKQTQKDIDKAIEALKSTLSYLEDIDLG